MTSHIPVERLSSYLDAELGEAEASAVERHVRECATCREDLQGLRRVVSGLRKVERASPPPVLAQEVARRVALERPPQGLVERLEAQLGKRATIDSGLAVGFTLVLALAVILYLFADAVDRRQRRHVPIVVPGASSAPADGVDEALVLDGRVFYRREGWWAEAGTQDPSRVLEAEEPAARALRSTWPWIDELLDRSRGVVLLEGGESVAIAASRGVTPGGS